MNTELLKYNALVDRPAAMRRMGAPRGNQFEAWEYHQNLMWWTGISFRMHYRRAMRKRGVTAVARQMRKQGFRLPLVLAVLTRG